MASNRVAQSKMRKLENPTTYFFEQAEQVPSEPNPEVLLFSQSLLQMEKCPLCKNPYHLKEEDRIPRIMVHCGHTFCTKCLLHFYMNKRVRCPMCLKLVKKIHSISALPINHTIYEALAVKDQENARQTETPPMVSHPHKIIYSEFIRSMGANTAKISPPDFDKEAGLQYCAFHQDRIEHFFCMFHENSGCRKCMEEGHKLPGCRVLDLYELQQPKAKNSEQMLHDIEQDIRQMED